MSREASEGGSEPGPGTGRKGPQKLGSASHYCPASVLKFAVWVWFSFFGGGGGVGICLLLRQSLSV